MHLVHAEPVTLQSELKKPMDPCKPNPCMNDGVCSLLGGSFRCDCRGFEGPQCETSELQGDHTLHQSPGRCGPTTTTTAVSHWCSQRGVRCTLLWDVTSSSKFRLSEWLEFPHTLPRVVCKPIAVMWKPQSNLTQFWGHNIITFSL